METGVVSLHNAPVNSMVDLGKQNDAWGDKRERKQMNMRRYVLN
jgi:hypothetical protein